MMWQPSTVEDIQKWIAGEYVPNPTAEEFNKMWRERIQRLSREGHIPRVCLVPRDHPSQR